MFSLFEISSGILGFEINQKTELTGISVAGSEPKFYSLQYLCIVLSMLS